MPARLAISSVEAPCSPRSANSPTAASRISSRRSSALFRWGWTTMGCKLVTTHKFVKGLRDEVEIRLGETGMERQGEGAFEGPVGAGEGALVPVGTEAMQRVRADLRLDAPGSKLREHAVPSVDLDDVRLPAMHVPVVRVRQHDRQVAKALLVGGGEPGARGVELAQPAQLREADRAEDVREAVVQAGRGHVVVPPSVMAQGADAFGRLEVVRRDCTALSRRDDLARVEGEAAERAEPAACAPAATRAERAGGILDHGHVRQLLEAGGAAEEV